ncbi:MAG: ATP-binding protein [Gaiellaceae bacterium]
MSAPRSETLPLLSDQDVVRARRRVREEAVRLGFGSANQAKLLTAASELARNAIVYGGGGTLTIEAFSGAGTDKLQLTFEDRGPGIRDVELALRDGYTSGGGLGVGLGGSRRLVDEFELDTHPGEGTRMRIAQRP